MLQGIMKYRTTRETLCWYSRSRSKAPGAMGYWQAVMLGRHAAGQSSTRRRPIQGRAATRLTRTPSGPDSLTAASPRLPQRFPSSRSRRAKRLGGTFSSERLALRRPSRLRGCSRGSPVPPCSAILPPPAGGASIHGCRRAAAG